jgi:cell division protease FtsH
VTLRGNSAKGEFVTAVKLPPAVADPKAPPIQATAFNCNIPAMGDPTLLPELFARKVEVAVTPAEGSAIGNMFLYLLPWLLIIGVWWFVVRGMKAQGPGTMMGGFARSGAKAYTSERIDVTFADVAGLDEAKQ